LRPPDAGPGTDMPGEETTVTTIDFGRSYPSSPKQIDDETKYQSNDNQYQAQRRPILCAAPTGLIYDRWGIGARRFGGLAGLVASLRVDD